ncbi:MAG: HAD family hydrolase [Firmicutes bacterium]|nr:HAD family hydrolase [Bacillota bacterium]
MFKAVLFDLDGTLVHYDYDAFLKSYLSSIAGYMGELVKPKDFIQKLMISTEVMLNSAEGKKTNMQIFWDDFPDRVGLAREVLHPMMEDFYAEDFPKLQKALDVKPIASARIIIEDLLARNIKVVIATNPIFPITAIEERMRWGDIADLPYTLITSYENSRYSKPNIKYYEEILEHINCLPQECLMIGNNTCEDLVAGDLGITTFLVEDCLLDIGPFQREPDHQGSFADLSTFIAAQFVCTKSNV